MCTELHKENYRPLSLSLSLALLKQHPLPPLTNPHAHPKCITIFSVLPSHIHTYTQFPEQIVLGGLLILLSFSQSNLRKAGQAFLPKT